MSGDETSSWDFLTRKCIETLSSSSRKEEKLGVVNWIMEEIQLIHKQFGAFVDECLTLVPPKDSESESSINFPEPFCQLSDRITRTGPWIIKKEDKIPGSYRDLFRDLELIRTVEEDSGLLLENFENSDENDYFPVVSCSEPEEEEETEKKGKLLQKKKYPRKPKEECPKCGGMYNRYFMKEHVSKCRKTQETRINFPPLICFFCRRSYFSFSYYRDHLKSCPERKDPNEGYLCNKCQKFFPSKTDSEGHTCEPFYRCDKCPYRSFDQSSYRSHVMRHHTLNPIKVCCETCGKTFFDKRMLTLHSRQHSNERPYLCTECGKSYARNDILNKHMARCHFTTPSACKICGKIFKSLPNLDYHVKEQHPPNGILKMRQCPHCSSRFRSGNYLRRHIQQHHFGGTQIFSCQNCSRNFKCKYALARHNKTDSCGSIGTPSTSVILTSTKVITTDDIM